VSGWQPELWCWRERRAVELRRPELLSLDDFQPHRLSQSHFPREQVNPSGDGKAGREPATCAAGSFPKATHREDPPTSREAEARVTELGTRAAHAAAVLAEVVARPGLSARELAERVTLGPGVFSADPHERLYQVRRRLSDLRGLDRVRRYRVRGRREVVWFAVRP
jgi:hypothetical protein